MTQQKLNEQQPYTVSLWLLPPEGEVFNSWQDEINRLAHLHEDSAGVAFLPHITLVGGVMIQRPQQINELVETLQKGLRGMGPVQCKFQSPNLLNFATNAETGEPIWNQAAVAAVVPTPRFLYICRRARQLLGKYSTALNDSDKENDCIFAPPLLQPHLSLYYGRTGVPTADEIHLPTSSGFTSDRVALWKTFPSYNETNVPFWNELAVISLR
jgi:hypothetical protein